MILNDVTMMRKTMLQVLVFLIIEYLIESFFLNAGLWLNFSVDCTIQIWEAILIKKMVPQLIMTKVNME